MRPLHHVALRLNPASGKWWLEILIEPTGDYLPQRVKLCLESEERYP